MATIGILGAYLHMESDEDISIILEGRLTELLVNIEPNLYRKYVVIEKSVKVLQSRFKKSLCVLFLISI